VGWNVGVWGAGIRWLLKIRKLWCFLFGPITTSSEIPWFYFRFSSTRHFIINIHPYQLLFRQK
jgi:hypothetical protein